MRFLVSRLFPVEFINAGKAAVQSICEIACVCLLIQSFKYLVSGFVGEGEGEDIFWFYSLLDTVEDLCCYYSCFTGSGTGEDQLYAGAGNGFVPGRGEGHA